MKVGWFEAKEYHRDNLKTDHEVEFFDKPVNDYRELEEDFDVITISLNSNLNREILNNLKPKRVICRSSGYDHVDLELIEDLGLEFYNTPDYCSSAVAEYTLALILHMTKELGKDLGKNPRKRGGTTGIELEKKKLGLIGSGKIGKEVIKRAKNFKMDIQVYDPYIEEEEAENLGFNLIDLEELLQTSDIISLHCPLTDSTEKILGEDEFEKMQDVFLVNTARGELLDSKALQKAITEGKINKAALDVVEEGKYEELSKRDDIYFTPHNAYNTWEAKERRLKTISKSIEGNAENQMI